MFFEREMLNQNNEKHLIKTIGYKLQYTIYGSTNTVIANLISLANIGTRVKFNFSCLRHWFSDLAKRKLPMQYTASTEVYVDKEQKIKP